MDRNTTYATSKLRGRIVEKFGTVDAFSNKTSLTRASVSDYLNGKKTLNQRDIREWMLLLDISDSELFDYFFVQEVDETKPNNE